MTPEAVAEVHRLLGPKLCWRALLREAHRHSVLLLLQRNLKLHFWSDVPAQVRDPLTASCRLSQQRNLALTAELVRIVETLETAGIAAIPFKGPVLSITAYGNPALRSFADLDILIHEKDLTRARQVLVGQGYVPAFSLTAREERAYRKEECALQFRHAERNTVLELHWHLTERYLAIELPIASWRQNSRPLLLAGRTVRTFAPEDLFLYLCVHAGKHKWERLEWLSSIAAVMEANPGLPWDVIARRATRYGIDRLVQVTLLLTNQLLRTPLPAPYRNADRDRAAGELVKEVVSTLFTSQESVLRDRANWYLFLLRTRERWFDKARIAAFSSLRMPHPEARQSTALPPALAFLHYVFRPARLAHSLVRLACRRLFTERTPRTPESARRLAGSGSPQNVSEAKLAS